MNQIKKAEDLEKIKSLTYTNSKIDGRNLLIVIVFLTAQSFNIFDISWALAILITFLFFYIGGIDSNSSSYLNALQLERELMYRDEKIEFLNKELRKLEEKVNKDKK